MKPKELATILNVSQGQITRYLKNQEKPPDYMMESWRREMRDAETYLREYFKGD